MGKHYHTIERVPKFNENIVERGRFDTPNTYMATYFLAWYRHFCE
jgi:uncharacterized membrane protein (DUF485 family)